VVYELERLTSSSAQVPDWGFKAAVAISANGSSYVMHMKLPFAQPSGSGSGSGSGSIGSAAPAAGAGSAAAAVTWQDALAVAEYGSGHWMLYSLAESEEKGGLVVAELQHTILRGVAALTLCRTGAGGGDIFLVGLSYYDKGFDTRSAVYKWVGRAPLARVGPYARVSYQAPAALSARAPAG
jgi:hypothetical protein